MTLVGGSCRGSGFQKGWQAQFEGQQEQQDRQGRGCKQQLVIIALDQGELL